MGEFLTKQALIRVQGDFAVVVSGEMNARCQWGKIAWQIVQMDLHKKSLNGKEYEHDDA